MSRHREAILAAKEAALADWMPRDVTVDGVQIARVTVDVVEASADTPVAVAFVRLSSVGRDLLGRGWNK